MILHTNTSVVILNWPK